MSILNFFMASIIMRLVGFLLFLAAYEFIRYLIIDWVKRKRDSVKSWFKR